MSSSAVSRRCSATTKAGERCRAWAIAGTERCAAHSRAVGAPEGNQNRLTHGFYAAPTRKLGGLDDVIEDQLDRQEQLSAYIDEQMAAGGGDPEAIIKLFGLSAQNASRLGRLLRDQRALSGKSADGLLEALGLALDEISTELGIKL